MSDFYFATYCCISQCKLLRLFNNLFFRKTSTRTCVTSTSVCRAVSVGCSAGCRCSMRSMRGCRKICGCGLLLLLFFGYHIKKKNLQKLKSEINQLAQPEEEKERVGLEIIGCFCCCFNFIISVIIPDCHAVISHWRSFHPATSVDWRSLCHAASGLGSSDQRWRWRKAQEGNAKLITKQFMFVLWLCHWKQRTNVDSFHIFMFLTKHH